MHTQQHSSSFGFSSSFSGKASQVQAGNQQKYQPVGMVKSQYDQRQQAIASSNQAQTFGTRIGTTSTSFAASRPVGTSSFQSATGFRPSGIASSQMGHSQSNAFMSPQSFHTSNYRGSK